MNDILASDYIFLTGGGLDSTAQVILIMNNYVNLSVRKLLLMHIDYGQRAAMQEFHYVKKLAKKYNLSFTQIDLKHIIKESDNLLFIKHSIEEPIDREKTVVLFRNPFLISVALFILLNDKRFKDWRKADILVGFHREPDRVFLDAQGEFLNHINNMLSYLEIDNRVLALFADKDRKEIIKEAYKLDSELFDLSWSCYLDYERGCGVCPHCLQQKEIMKELGFAEDELRSYFIK